MGVPRHFLEVQECEAPCELVLNYFQRVYCSLNTANHTSSDRLEQ